MADTRHLVNYLTRVVHFECDEFLPGHILKRALQSIANEFVRTPLNATLFSPSGDPGVQGWWVASMATWNGLDPATEKAN